MNLSHEPGLKSRQGARSPQNARGRLAPARNCCSLAESSAIGAGSLLLPDPVARTTGFTSVGQQGVSVLLKRNQPESARGSSLLGWIALDAGIAGVGAWRSRQCCCWPIAVSNPAHGPTGRSAVFRCAAELASHARSGLQDPQTRSRTTRIIRSDLARGASERRSAETPRG